MKKQETWAFMQSELFNMGFKLEDMLKRFIEIDYETMKNLNEEAEGIFEQWLPVFRLCNNTVCVLLDVNNSIIGYWHFVALNDEAYERAVKGRLNDIDLSPDIIFELNKEGMYNGYVVSIGIVKEHRNIENFSKLANAFISTINGYKRRGIIFTNWCANAYTKEGEDLCKSAGLKYRCDNSCGGNIYVGALEKL